jgi:hypothetical protein
MPRQQQKHPFHTKTLNPYPFATLVYIIVVMILELWHHILGQLKAPCHLVICFSMTTILLAQFVRERLQNYLGFIWSRILKNVHQLLL